MAVRFDTSALTGRVSGRRFRGEAIAGDRGEDLVVSHSWKRAEYSLLVVLFVAMAVGLPVGSSFWSVPRCSGSAWRHSGLRSWSYSQRWESARGETTAGGLGRVAGTG
jgi:hypothetical protein